MACIIPKTRKKELPPGGVGGGGSFLVLLLLFCHKPKGSHTMTHPKETFVIEVEIIKSEMESSEVVVEGEYMSTEKMEELGYSEHFVQNELSHWSLIALWCPVYTQ